MTQHQVMIAGGGPTGMMLAGELALAGIDVAIIERRATPEVIGSRAGGLHARSIEVLDQRGIAGRFLREGQPVQVHGFSGARLDISDFPTRYPYSLGLRQAHIERILLGWLEELGVPILRGRDLTGFVQDDGGVDIALSDGPPVRAQYLIGCDGGRSVVRKTAGIEFPGWDPTVSHLIAEVELAETPEWGGGIDAIGLHSLGRVDYTVRDGKVVYADHGPARVMVTERRLDNTGDPTLSDLSAALIAHYGTDYGVHSPTSITRFTDMARQAAQYRRGRVLLAGDAAHVHYPAGGHGLNTGLQDAVNLGWKLAQVLKGTSTEQLLDSYHAERHPVAVRVLRETLTAVALNRQDERTKAMRGTLAELVAVDGARKYLGGQMSELDIRYDLGDAHPLLGRRMPDLDLATANGPTRVFALMHKARPLFITLGTPLNLDITPWADRVEQVDAAYAGAWELPVVGIVPAPAAVLVRPDGHVAWVGDGTDTGLRVALAKWFGAPGAA